MSLSWGHLLKRTCADLSEPNLDTVLAHSLGGTLHTRGLGPGTFKVPSGDLQKPVVGNFGPQPLLEGPGPPAVRPGAGRCLPLPPGGKPSCPGLEGTESRPDGDTQGDAAGTPLVTNPSHPSLVSREKAEGRTKIPSDTKTASQTAEGLERWETIHWV